MSRISRGAKKASKSIYAKIEKKTPTPQPIPILTIGSRLSHQLHISAEFVSNPRLQRISSMKETMKLSAAMAGTYYLSAN